MENILGFRQSIAQENKNVHQCVECGNPLTKGEYNEMFDMCKSCKKRTYDNGSRRTRDEVGNNRIDEILIDTIGGRIQQWEK